MLPTVINEDQTFSFEFWFNGTIRQGMYYHNELYCKLKAFDLKQRSQVYQLGCKLAKKDTLVVITCTSNSCSLWGNLRALSIKDILLNQKVLNVFSPNPASANSGAGNLPDPNQPDKY